MLEGMNFELTFLIIFNVLHLFRTMRGFTLVKSRINVQHVPKAKVFGNDSEYYKHIKICALIMNVSQVE